MTESSLIETEDVRSGYRNAEIIHDMTIQVSQGEIVGVLGPNGSGKSTFMKTLMGLVNFMGGTMKFKGDPIMGFKPYERARLGIGYVPQQDAIFPELSVTENLRLASFSNPEGYEARLDDVFDLFPQLFELRDTTADLLSGGERKMLALGCGMIIDPELYLLDEPSDGLAPDLATNTFNKIHELQSGGKSILVNEQKEEILDHIDRAYVLESGTLQTQGTAEELLDQGVLEESYFRT